MKWLLIPANQIQTHNAVVRIVLSGRTYCMVRQDDQLFVTGNRCPHAGADISQGWCENGHLVCPYHRHQFDLQTGRGAPGQGNYLPVFPIKKEGEDWWLGIEAPWWKFWNK